MKFRHYVNSWTWSQKCLCWKSYTVHSPPTSELPRPAYAVRFEQTLWCLRRLYKTLNLIQASVLFSCFQSCSRLVSPFFDALVVSVAVPGYVEIGRVALVNYGPQYGKLVVIVDVVDQNRALVDSPEIVRTQINFKRLSLTDIKIDIRRNPKRKELKKAIDGTAVHGKWEKSSRGRKLIVQKTRANLNDFDRFKVVVARIKRSSIIKRELSKLKKEIKTQY